MIPTNKNKFSYGITLSRLTRQLYNRQITAFTFLENMQAAINTEFTTAWNDGLASVGIQPNEQTTAELLELESLIRGETQYILPFATAIQDGRDRDGKPLSSFLVRASLWENAYNRIRNRARLMASSNPKLRWQLGATEDHCVDCTTYAGRVYRAQVWDAHGIAPQSRELSCNGYGCECQFVPTDEPALTGRPPTLSRRRL